MDGLAELMQLAALLRLGAETGRQIATLRPADGEAIERLACRTEDIAAEIEAIVEQGGRMALSN